jgi:CheY-like chemotaxis protein
MLESVRLRCLIVDDNASFLHASRALLERQGINVVGVATTSREALQRAKELNPDLILVDVDLGAD